MKFRLWWDDLALLAMWIPLLASGVNVSNWRGWVFIVSLAIFKMLSVERADRVRKGRL